MGTAKSINGKNILFLAPSFFGYENKIKDKMIKMGASVDLYDERSVTKAFDRALLKIAPSLFNNKTRNYYMSILNRNKNKKYDYVFIVKCEMMTQDMLKEFRSTFKGAVFCLYLWDSIRNIKGITSKFKYFDRVLSFDLQDVKKYPEMKFRPLFYSDDFKKEVKSDNIYKYDISFCGTVHSDRYKIIRHVKSLCNIRKWNSYFFCYLQSNFIFYFYKLIKLEFKGAKKSDFTFDKLSSSEIANVVDESRVILDIQHPKQTGLTMRTIEMVGMNKKLITTNGKIKEYDFYNPNNILIIDRNNINILEGFLLTKYEPLDASIYEKYSMTAWIEDILYDIE